MLACLCPRCGRPAPLSLATPTQIACAACRYTGTPDALVVEQLGAAAAALAGLGVEARQLSAVQRRELARGRLTLGCLTVLWVVATVPFALLLGAGVFVLAPEAAKIEGMGQHALLALAFLAPLVIVLGAGASARWLLRSRLRRLEARCVAAPPAGPGEPSRCHVCGAPLVGAIDAGVVRCAYCHADNVVEHAALARQAGRHRVVLADYAREVQAHATSTSGAGAGAMVAIVAVALATPLVVVVACALAVFGLSSIERPVDSRKSYVVVERAGNRCVGEVLETRPGGTRRVDMNNATRVGFPGWLELAPTEGTPVRLVELVGRRVRIDDRTGRVTGFFASALGVNMLRLADVTGDGWGPPPVAGACLLDR